MSWIRRHPLWSTVIIFAFAELVIANLGPTYLLPPGSAGAVTAAIATSVAYLAIVVWFVLIVRVVLRWVFPGRNRLTDAQREAR